MAQGSIGSIGELEEVVSAGIVSAGPGKMGSGKDDGPASISRLRSTEGTLADFVFISLALQVLPPALPPHADSSRL